MKFLAFWSGSTALAALTCGILLLSSAELGATAEKTAADYFVRSLPGAPDGPLLRMHAG